jgi:hypothetical protein
MSKLLATAFTVLAASGCAASSTPAAPIDDEPPPSSGPCGWLWPPPTDAWPDGDPKSDPISTSDLVFNPPTGFTADVGSQRTRVSR